MSTGRFPFGRRLSLLITGGLLVMIAAAAVMARGVGAEADLAHTDQNLLRLHVVAHSDHPDEQAVKLKVRDAVLAQMAHGDVPTSRDHAVALIRAEEHTLEMAAEAALRSAGSTHSVQVQVGPAYFPERSLDGMVFPAGSYQAVRVVIGDGAGKNWWCVLFPPLCFIEHDGEVAPFGVGPAEAEASTGAHGADEGSESEPPAQMEGGSTGISWEFRLWKYAGLDGGRMRDWFRVSLGLSDEKGGEDTHRVSP